MTFLTFLTGFIFGIWTAMFLNWFGDRLIEWMMK